MKNMPRASESERAPGQRSEDLGGVEERSTLPFRRCRRDTFILALGGLGDTMTKM